MGSVRTLDTRRRLFTLEEANGALPLVRAIVADIVHQWQVISDFEDRLAPILERRRAHKNEPWINGGKAGSDPADSYSEELEQQRLELEEQRQVFRNYLAELDKLGIKLRGAHNGLCDFPSTLDGREVFLCWKLGEPSVSTWHEYYEAYADRKTFKVDSPLRREFQEHPCG